MNEAMKKLEIHFGQKFKHMNGPGNSPLWLFKSEGNVLYRVYKGSGVIERHEWFGDYWEVV